MLLNLKDFLKIKLPYNKGTAQFPFIVFVKDKTDSFYNYSDYHYETKPLTPSQVNGILKYKKLYVPVKFLYGPKHGLNSDISEPIINVFIEESTIEDILKEILESTDLEKKASLVELIEDNLSENDTYSLEVGELIHLLKKVKQAYFNQNDLFKFFNTKVKKGL